MDRLLNIGYQLQQYRNYNLKVTLKSTDKGIGLVVTQPVYKNEVIAFYKLKIFKERDYESSTYFKYSFSIPRKNKEYYKIYIGDIFEGSFPPPEQFIYPVQNSNIPYTINIPYWGPFINEPSIHETSNCKLDMNIKYNYHNKTKSSPGETMIFSFIATQYLNPGDEILWYYGPDYERDYKVNTN